MSEESVWLYRDIDHSTLGELKSLLAECEARGATDDTPLVRTEGGCDEDGSSWEDEFPFVSVDFNGEKITLG